MKIIRIGTVGSTNQFAAEYEKQKGTREDFTVIAREQTAGKGTRGRSFLSLPDNGLYASFVFYRHVPAELAGHVTVSAAVCVREALRTVTGKSAEIKWINDLYYGGKKVCGILCEGGELLPGDHAEEPSGFVPDTSSPEAYERCFQGSPRLSGSTFSRITVGVGINLGTAPFPPELTDIAGSLSVCETVTPELSDTLADEISRRLDTEIRSISEHAERKDYTLSPRIYASYLAALRNSGNGKCETMIYTN